MANNTKPTKEKSSYWGYIIFSVLALAFILNSSSVWSWYFSGELIDHSKAYQSTTSRNNNTNNTSRYNTNSRNSTRTNTVNFCNLNTNEIIKKLGSERNYTLNGNGYVRFTERFDHTRNKWVENKFRVSGNLNSVTMEGDWKMVSRNRIAITNYRVISGSFDASRNNRTRGYLNLNCDGSLTGTLYDRNGNNIDVNIISKSR